MGKFPIYNGPMAAVQSLSELVARGRRQLGRLCARDWRSTAVVALLSGVMVLAGSGEDGPPPESTGYEAIGSVEGGVSAVERGATEGAIVWVDGVAYRPGMLDTALLDSLRPGQRVRLAFDASGRAHGLQLVSADEGYLPPRGAPVGNKTLVVDRRLDCRFLLPAIPGLHTS